LDVDEVCDEAVDCFVRLRLGEGGGGHFGRRRGG
jgi:hypothetical protein